MADLESTKKTSSSRRHWSEGYENLFSNSQRSNALPPIFGDAPPQDRNITVFRFDTRNSALPAFPLRIRRDAERNTVTYIDTAIYRPITSNLVANYLPNAIPSIPNPSYTPPEDPAEDDSSSQASEESNTRYWQTLNLPELAERLEEVGLEIAPTGDDFMVTVPVLVETVGDDGVTTIGRRPPCLLSQVVEDMEERLQEERDNAWDYDSDVGISADDSVGFSDDSSEEESVEEESKEEIEEESEEESEEDYTDDDSSEDESLKEWSEEYEVETEEVEGLVQDELQFNRRATYLTQYSHSNPLEDMKDYVPYAPYPSANYICDDLRLAATYHEIHQQANGPGTTTYTPPYAYAELSAQWLNPYDQANPELAYHYDISNPATHPPPNPNQYRQPNPEFPSASNPMYWHQQLRNQYHNDFPALPSQRVSNEQFYVAMGYAQESYAREQPQAYPAFTQTSINQSHQYASLLAEREQDMNRRSREVRYRHVVEDESYEPREQSSYPLDEGRVRLGRGHSF